MKNYIVTGGAGHLGSHIVDELISRGDRVLVIDNLLTGKKENLNPAAEFIQSSVASAAASAPNFKGNFDGVFHLAAYINVRAGNDTPQLMSENGANLTAAALDIARRFQIPKFVFVSSMIVKYNPRIPYGIEKEMSERYCLFFQEHFNLDVSIIRLHSVYGSPRHHINSGNVIPSFIEQKKAAGKLQVSGDGRQIRDFVYYTDAVDAILAAENRRGICEIGTCQGHTILEVAKHFNCPIEFIGRPRGEVDKQVCEKSDFITKVSFEEGMKRVTSIK